jgi:TetR/AcrR family transcriptional regulator, tetracycline repressor protein
VDTSTTSPRAGRYSRDDVLSSALVLLETHGLAELTMRKLALELGVQPSALYWHVPNKQQLLAELADRIVARARLVPSDADWQREVIAVARSLRDALMSCRDGAELVSSSLALGLGGTLAQRQLSDAIARASIDSTLADTTAVIIVHQILGQVWHEQQRSNAERLGVPVAHARDESLNDQVDLGVELVLLGLAKKSLD